MKSLIGIIGIVLISIAACIVMYLSGLGSLSILVFMLGGLFIIICLLDSD